MKPLSPFKNDVKLTLFLLMIPLVLFLVAPGFFISRATMAAEHTHPHPESENTPEEPTEISPQKTGKTWAYTLLGIYCSVIVFSSLLGGWLPSLIRLTHTRMETLISFVGGLMLGIGVFHLLPHAVAEMGSVDRAVWWMMVGIVTLFFLLRTFHFHQHGTVKLDEEEDHKHDHDHDCDHHHAHAPVHSHNHSHQLSWIGIALGLALHTLIDGLALGASIIAEQHHEVFLSLFGLGTFLAITLHKPLDAVSITSLMAAGGWSAGWRNAVNIGFALMCPLGALLFFLGVQQFSGIQHIIIGCALAFSAGVFICISLGDLLPEMEFHSHNRFRLSFVLLLGIALAYGIGFIEPGHVHDHGGQSEDSHDHDHKHEH
ncbi:ZIP family metal transporter [Gimesia fumaroli]|uniref:Zinc transporter ZupT n=1 Tax=Gimesia fumaroli TaxID=2527976 RepID=A0A518I5K3_9PLAN|nr:ZIP family metal transporter [Gimesia fumaroli]QDV48325.1 zinc transporter ZupT [Gimesia fumaroli]